MEGVRDLWISKGLFEKIIMGVEKLEPLIKIISIRTA
jgi:hypothetical protein